MGQNIRITCVKLDPQREPCERVRKIGGVYPDGSRWQLRIEEAIAGASAGKWHFHVDGDVHSMVKVIIATSSGGQRFLKSQYDGLEPSSLLKLPECPD
ncbi:DUF3892 domain-containing protein [Diaphorobacter sp.]|uniref:DUF3892 domain-containing protein n=1 Tax=Diaphorobacter sp. TaxID=1934310 RepID=UPI003917CA1C